MALIQLTCGVVIVTIFTVGLIPVIHASENDVLLLSSTAEIQENTDDESTTVIATLPENSEESTISTRTNLKLQVPENFDEDLSLLNITSGTITLSIQSDNVLTLTTSNNRSLLASISIKLDNETEAISLPITCVIAQSEDDQIGRSRQKPVDCPRHPIIKGCRHYSAIITVTFADESQLEIAKNFTTYPEDPDGLVTDLKSVQSGPDYIKVQWMKPKCDSNLPVVNYSVSIIPTGSPSEKLLTRWIPADGTRSSHSFLNLTSEEFKLKPCTEYNIKVRPLYSIQWAGSSSPSIAASTAPTEEDRIRDFSAIWQNDRLVLSWAGLNCVHNLIGWKLDLSYETAISHQHHKTVNVVIPKHCSLVLATEGNTTKHHGIQMIIESDGIICQDDTVGPFHFRLKACVTYSIGITPIWSDSGVQFQRDGFHVETKAPPLMKFPGRPGGMKMMIEGPDDAADVLFVWRSPLENPKCVHHYLYSINYDSVTVERQETTEALIKVPFKPCTRYSMSVWSVGWDGLSKSRNALLSQGFTPSGDIELPELETSIRAINNSCLLVSWLIPPDYNTTISCVGFYFVHLQPPSEEGRSTWQVDNNRINEQMICQLLPGTEYHAHVQIVTPDGKRSLAADTVSETTYTTYDKATTGLIVVITLLVLAILLITLFVTRPWITNSAERMSRTGSLSRRSMRMMQVSIMGHLGRRRAHPIKVRELEQVTKRLCASAGHKLELEFEDLNIIADSRRAPASPAALLAENKNKNRYINILPFEQSRVLLNILPDDPFSDYINASYIMGFNRPREYIASQGPKDSTFPDFWRMIWEQEIHLIVMVTGLEERGKVKCDRYWPEEGEESVAFGELVVRQSYQTDYPSYTLRCFQIKLNDQSRTVNQMHLKAWPDFGCPENPESLIRFIEVIRLMIVQQQELLSSPILVHCSAGVGRTGTFIAVDWLMQEARVNKTIDIFSTILRLREYRVSMVQSEDQYEFIYKCLTHYVNTRICRPFSESLTMEMNMTDCGHFSETTARLMEADIPSTKDREGDANI